MLGQGKKALFHCVGIRDVYNNCNTNSVVVQPEWRQITDEHKLKELALSKQVLSNK